MSNNDFALYLPHSDEDELWQLVCTDVGNSQVEANQAYPAHAARHPAPWLGVVSGRRLDEYQLVYISAGSGILSVEGRQYQVEPGSMFLLFPGVLHAYRPDPDTGWTEWWAGFRGPWADALVDADAIAPDRPLFHLGYQPTLISSFQAMFELARRRPQLYQFKVSAEVMRLLAETLSLHRRAARPSRAQEIVERTKVFIEAHLGTGFDLQALEAEVHLRAPQLNKVFKSCTGMTPYQYGIEARIDRAKQLLGQQRLSMKEIAWEVGFSDPYYFSRLFKLRTGVSPSRWRRAAEPSVSRSCGY